MILVTLGTQDKSFKRLLEAVEKQIDNGTIKDKVVVQAGLTKYQSDKMEIFDFIPVSKFDDLIKSCDILITHAGVGSIITGLKNNKKVIAAARLKKYHEHTNDHQLQIVDNFAKSGYILPLDNFDELDKVLQKAKKFKPKAYESNTKNFVKLIKDYIDNH
ncbi:MAG: exopolysaccharide biosynthesis protein [Bacilli bacterium]|nr:exopolysaccharide biosynthesis protein [Bacilli bacterium]